MPASIADCLYRLAYRIGFRLLRAAWRLTRPHHVGAVVAVWHGGEILMLRQSYRPELCWPGGGIGRGEAPRDAASRELGEEIGLCIDPEQLRFWGRQTHFWDNRQDEVHIFELHLSGPPALRCDRREVLSAAFVPPAALHAAPVAPFIRAYLASQAPARPAQGLAAGHTLV